MRSDQLRPVGGTAVRVMELTGRPGDVVLTHPWVLHCAAPNTGTHPRMMLTKNLYRRSPAPPRELRRRRGVQCRGRAPTDQRQGPRGRRAPLPGRDPSVAQRLQRAGLDCRHQEWVGGHDQLWRSRQLPAALGWLLARPSSWPPRA